MAQAFEIPGFQPPLRAGADLRTRQFHAVNIDSTGRLVLAGAGTRAVGFLQNKPNLDESATLMNNGITKAVNGTAGALAAGVTVMADATGRVVLCTAGSDVVGVTVTAATAVDELVAVLILLAPTP